MGLFESHHGKIKNWRDYLDSGPVGKMFTGEDTSELCQLSMTFGARCMVL